MRAGTVRNSVKLAVLDSQWQQKKRSGELFSQNRDRELTAEERQRALFQQQAEDIRKSRERADIDAKLSSGQKLTPEEIEYLRKTDPQALREYEEIERERKAYREALRNCRSKEEAEDLKLQKMGGLIAQARKISNNPNIPKGEKKQLLEKILRITGAVTEEHLKFVKSLQYQELPEKREDADEGRGDACEETPEETEKGGSLNAAGEPEAENEAGGGTGTRDGAGIVAEAGGETGARDGDKAVAQDRAGAETGTRDRDKAVAQDRAGAGTGARDRKGTGYEPRSGPGGIVVDIVL